MLDGVSLDQLLTFIAAAEEGSFSAAGASCAGPSLWSARLWPSRRNCAYTPA
jgi:hypothetical protein